MTFQVSTYDNLSRHTVVEFPLPYYNRWITEMYFKSFPVINHQWVFMKYVVLVYIAVFLTGLHSA